LLNSPGFSTTNGGSISFDGVDDYVGSIRRLNVSSASTTIISWFQTNNTSKTNQSIVTRNRSNLLLLAGSGGFTWWPDVQLGSVSISTTIVANRWYNVAVTQTGTVCNLFLNGVKIYTNNSTNTFRSNLSDNLTFVGAYTDGRYFSGLIPTVLIYNAVLSDDQILQNYNATKGRFGL
jgi:hypothetical protein